MECVGYGLVVVVFEEGLGLCCVDGVDVVV